MTTRVRPPLLVGFFIVALTQVVIMIYDDRTAFYRAEFACDLAGGVTMPRPPYECVQRLSVPVKLRRVPPQRPTPPHEMWVAVDA